MVLFKGNAVNGSANIAVPAFAGAAVVNRFTMPVPAAAKIGDILEIGLLPANTSVSDITVFADAVGLKFDVGLMTGEPGTDSGRGCGDEFFTACDMSAGGVARPAKSSACRVVASPSDRAIGLKITAGTAATQAGTIGLTVTIYA